MKKIILGFFAACIIAALVYVLISVVGHYSMPFIETQPGWTNSNFYKNMGNFGAGIIAIVSLSIVAAITIMLGGVFYSLGDNITNFINKKSSSN